MRVVRVVFGSSRTFSGVSRFASSSTAASSSATLILYLGLGLFRVAIRLGREVLPSRFSKS